MKLRTLKLNIRRDFNRLFWPLVIAAVLITFGVDFARWVGMPEIAPWGTFTGAVFFAGSITHLLRRMLFPKVDLQNFAEKAFDTSTGAGLVVLGMCLVISAIITMAGAMLRT